MKPTSSTQVQFDARMAFIKASGFPEETQKQLRQLVKRIAENRNMLEGIQATQNRMDAQVAAHGEGIHSLEKKMATLQEEVKNVTEINDRNATATMENIELSIKLGRAWDEMLKEHKHNKEELVSISQSARALIYETRKRTRDIDGEADRLVDRVFTFRKRRKRCCTS